MVLRGDRSRLVPPRCAASTDFRRSSSRIRIRPEPACAWAIVGEGLAIGRPGSGDVPSAPLKVGLHEHGLPTGRRWTTAADRDYARSQSSPLHRGGRAGLGLVSIQRRSVNLLQDLPQLDLTCCSSPDLNIIRAHQSPRRHHYLGKVVELAPRRSTPHRTSTRALLSACRCRPRKDSGFRSRVRAGPDPPRRLRVHPLPHAQDVCREGRARDRETRPRRMHVFHRTRIS
jgi:hypothetical protein